eukprot:CAMPEP_0198706272 /NCGR_PEP_ID=MMETSP1468-20131203/390880_1 /TAXON_ID=1461545 /ORGANISM="Mantoniella sp, Strain CCMP1436" /LENGTH=50 /DNA_ID=CAMNT_0044465207 /DNA_START=234 /DNA_END=386 /DNA_ORIENTATION=+
MGVGPSGVASVRGAWRAPDFLLLLLGETGGATFALVAARGTNSHLPTAWE